MDLFAITVFIFGLCMLGLATGVFFSRRRLKESCCSGGACTEKHRNQCAEHDIKHAQSPLIPQ